MRAPLATIVFGFAIAACTPLPMSSAPTNLLDGRADVATPNLSAVNGRARRSGGLTVLYTFGAAPDGSTPLGNVIVGKGGDVFGTTSLGGASGNGAVFELKRSQAYAESIVHSFDAADGAAPVAAPFEDANRNLFVTAGAGGDSGQYGALVELSPQSKGYVETGLFAFDQADGAYPGAGFLDLGGTLVTTTNGGGKNGYGNIVEVTGSGLSVTDVYDFANAPDGASPDAGLVADSSGALYGTTYYGGSGECPQGQHLFYHCGVVFKFVPSASGGSETVLYTFQGGADGASPYGGLIVDKHGNLYGTTVFGGDTNCGGNGNPDGCGTVFELSPQEDGTYVETVLHRFKGSPDGRYAYGGLVAKGDKLFGTTEFGGNASACVLGCGSIFEVSKSSKHYAVDHSFQGSDGANPQSGLTFKAGAFYGTTADGGNTGNGTVFQFEP
jgi:hypothetical protein